MQLDLNFARESGRSAANACQAKAERNGFDSEGAARFMLGWLRRHGPTSGEHLTEAAEAHGYRPINGGRAFGNVIQGMSRNKQIRCLRSDLPRRRGHGTSGGKLWEAI